jgi:hypothetical protein
MLIRQAIEDRVSAGAGGRVDAVNVGLPLRLKTERMNVKKPPMNR